MESLGRRPACGGHDRWYFVGTPTFVFAVQCSAFHDDELSNFGSVKRTSATQRIPIRLQRFCGRYRNLHSVQQPPHGGGRIYLGLRLVLA